MYVYDPFAGFFVLGAFVAFFAVFVGAVFFPWLPFVMMDSMGEWWRGRGERELQRAQAERERAHAAEARERAALIRELRLGASQGVIDPYQAQWYIHQLSAPPPPQLPPPSAQWQPWDVSRPPQRVDIVEGASRLIEQAHTALAHSSVVRGETRRW